MLTYGTYANLSALVPRHKAKAQLNEAKKLLVAENDALLGGIEIRELICEVVLWMCFRLFTVGAASSLTIACKTTIRMVRMVNIRISIAFDAWLASIGLPFSMRNSEVAGRLHGTEGSYPDWHGGQHMTCTSSWNVLLILHESDMKWIDTIRYHDIMALSFKQCINLGVKAPTRNGASQDKVGLFGVWNLSSVHDYSSFEEGGAWHMCSTTGSSFNVSPRRHWTAF